MIDICTVVHKNYALLDMQIEHWKRIKGEHRLLVVDNTPKHLRIPHRYPILDITGIDGETHGAALDYLIRQASSDIVGIVDTDFFWLNTDIVAEVLSYFDAGYKCVGCAGFYPDWQRNLDPRWPERAGHLAPACWGMFVDRKLALEQTFVVTSAEGSQIMETGWRLRKRLIEEDIPRITFQGYYPEDWQDPEWCFFHQDGKLQGMHFLKGSSFRAGMTARIPEILERYTYDPLAP